MKKFNVTYDIVTPESAEHGDYDEIGYIANAVSLREAIDLLFETRTCECDGVASIEPSCSMISEARWLNVVNGMEFLTGAVEARALHFPEEITGSSRKRIMVLCGVRC